MRKKHGVHLIVDLYNCDFSQLPSDQEALGELQRWIEQILDQHSLSQVGSAYHLSSPKALTATICLSDSHLSFHSWPEDSQVSLDLFICGREEESTKEAERVVDILAREVFGSADVRRLVVPR